MSYNNNEHTKTIKVRFKRALVLLLFIGCVGGNRPPRFLIDGQTEIVLRLREGDETPVGNNSVNLCDLKGLIVVFLKVL